ncbi:MAG: hypothetical protein M3O09_04140 [Acidobacteriota bacterium]|nr:hypothetical protein [Acidobacteriota bacterium]
MKNSFYMRMISPVALAIATALLLSNLAIAQDDDDSYSQQGDGQQAQHYGYEVGYRDGYSKGRHEGHENDPGDIDSWALQNATNGYQPWMGPVQYFQSGYRSGYSNGFRSGYQAVNRRQEDEDSGSYYPSGSYDEESQYEQ